MEQVSTESPATFIDRRQPDNGGPSQGPERRQFQDARENVSFEAMESAEAVDRYKLRHRRRFITFEELYDVISELGYHK